MKHWHGITYPTINGWLPDWFYSLWKNTLCKIGIHLFDEYYTYHVGPFHGLYCDACNLDLELSDKESEKK